MLFELNGRHLFEETQRSQSRLNSGVCRGTVQRKKKEATHKKFSTAPFSWSLALQTPYLQTPHFPPSFAQCLQYLQFLHAWQGSEPVQVAECSVAAAKTHVKRTIKQNPAIEKRRDLSMIASSNRRMESVQYIRGHGWLGQQERPLPQRK